MNQPHHHVSDHQRLDARSLAMHRLIARRIQLRPDQYLSKVQARLQRWNALHPDRPCIREWLGWLERPLPELLNFLVDESETATRLRQSSPFCGILSPQERKQFIESYSARTYYSRRERHYG